MDTADRVAANRRRWEERVAIHRADSTGFYRIRAFLDGDDALHPIEDAELPDLTGLRICHLQCHFGLDTLKLLRRGAASVVGVDYSGNALATAADLAAEVGLADRARWVQSDVREAHRALDGERFDLVYTTWGTVGWFPHVDRWGAAVSALVAPGGRFYMADGHPQMLAFEWEDDAIRHVYPWRSPLDAPIEYSEATTYTGDPTVMTHQVGYDWQHPLSDIFGGLLRGGLQLRRFAEHETLPWPAFQSCVKEGEAMYRLPDDAVPMPLAFSMLWERPG